MNGVDAGISGLLFFIMNDITHISGVFFNEEEMLYINNGYVPKLYAEIETLNYLKKHIDYTLKFYEHKKYTEQDIRDINFNLCNEYLSNIRGTNNYKSKEKKVREGFVYLMQNTKSKNLKIGFSKNPKVRLQQLNNASDIKIILLYNYKGTLESEKHALETWNDYRLNSEWFEFNEHLINWFHMRQNCKMAF